MHEYIVKNAYTKITRHKVHGSVIQNGNNSCSVKEIFSGIYVKITLRDVALPQAVVQSFFSHKGWTPNKIYRLDVIYTTYRV